MSETFVYNQVFRLKQYQAYMLGVKLPPAPHLNIPEDRLYLIRRGGFGGFIREVLFKLTGHIPLDVMRWASSVKPSLLHAHFGIDGSLIMPLAKKLTIPLVVSFHGTDATMKDAYAKKSFFSHRLYLGRRARLSEKVACIIVPSKYVLDCVVEQGYPKEKILIISHGIDLDEFAPSLQKPDTNVILYVGRLVKRKGLHYLIEAIHLLRSEFPDIQLIVIGDGPEKLNYERLAKEKLKNNFTFLGAQPNHRVKAELERATVFSMPSITMPSGEVETLGVVFLEAHAMGVPVVSFSSGAIPEVVIHGKTGFLAEEGNVRELASYIRTLLVNESLRNEMGVAARKHVERNFNLEIQNAKLEKLYDSVVNTDARYQNKET